MLNFVLPQIFDDLDSFQQWFDFTDLDSEGGHDRILNKEQSGQIITKLHAILKPFLLRRMKNEVEKDLPPKKESVIFLFSAGACCKLTVRCERYLLYAPLTKQQKEIYDAVVSKSIRSLLIDRKTGSQPASSREATPASAPSSPGGSIASTASSARGRRAKKRSYAEKSDDQFFDDLENGSAAPEDEDVDLQQRGRDFKQKQARPSVSLLRLRPLLIRSEYAVKSVNGLKLQNLVMQLRKTCNHPWLFDWPVDSRTGEQLINEDLINASGKMLMLNQLLTALFDKGHKVLLFSQFTSMLDIVQDWAQEYKGWNM